MKLKLAFISLLVLGTVTVSAAETRRTVPPVKNHRSNLIDQLEWLGPIPTKLSQEMIEKRTAAVFLKLGKVIAVEANPKQFICKSPAEIGPIPNMQAVDRYLMSWPDSTNDPELLKGLFDAASQGNWLARSHIFALLIGGRASSNIQTHYRKLQSVEWMVQKKHGPVFNWFVDSLAASGYFGAEIDLSGVDTIAALHNSYPAQERAGKDLLKSDDPELVAIGQAMRDCAANASPGYREVFKGTHWR